MTGKFDWEAMSIAFVGVLVFGILFFSGPVYSATQEEVDQYNSADLETFCDKYAPAAVIFYHTYPPEVVVPLFTQLLEDGRTRSLYLASVMNYASAASVPVQIQLASVRADCWARFRLT